MTTLTCVRLWLGRYSGSLTHDITQHINTLLMVKMKSSAAKLHFYFLWVGFFWGSSLLTCLDKCLCNLLRTEGNRRETQVWLKKKVLRFLLCEEDCFQHWANMLEHLLDCIRPAQKSNKTSIIGHNWSKWLLVYCVVFFFCDLRTVQFPYFTFTMWPNQWPRVQKIWLKPDKYSVTVVFFPSSASPAVFQILYILQV